MTASVIVLLVTLVSHFALFPTIYLFYTRKLTFELSVSVFGLLSSFMYHLSQALGHPLVLTDLHWHRLDNIGAISLTGLLFVNFACIKHSEVETCLKYAVFFLTLIFQEQNPWEEIYTAAPIILFTLIPVWNILMLERELPNISIPNLIKGASLGAISVLFFILGLNDEGDPYRILHGIWHVGIGIGSYYLWSIVKPFYTKNFRA